VDVRGEVYKGEERKQKRKQKRKKKKNSFPSFFGMQKLLVFFVLFSLSFAWAKGTFDDDEARQDQERTLERTLRDLQSGNIEKAASRFNSLNVNVPTPRGMTPLIFAIQNSYPLVEVLLKIPGIDVNKPGPDGCTPLHYAWRGSGEQSGQDIFKIHLIRLLLSMPEVDVTVRSQSQHWQCGSSFFQLAILDQTLVNLMLNLPGIANQCILHAVVSMDNINMVQRVLKIPGIDVNMMDSHGFVPLHYAFRSSGWEVISTLLSVPGIDINKSDPAGDHVLDYIVRHRGSSTLFLKLLLAFRPDWTLYHIARATGASMERGKFEFTHILGAYETKPEETSNAIREELGFCKTILLFDDVFFKAISFILSFFPLRSPRVIKWFNPRKRRRPSKEARTNSKERPPRSGKPGHLYPRLSAGHRK